MKKLKVTINGIAYQVEVEEIQDQVAVKKVTTPAPAVSAPAAPAVSVPQTPATVNVAAGENAVAAPMPGKVTKVLTQVGQSVKQGEVLLLLEAMKMQNEICAPVQGTVKSINAVAGQSVKNGEIMVVIK